MTQFTGLKNARDISLRELEALQESETPPDPSVVCYLGDQNENDDVSQESNPLVDSTPLPESVNGLAMVVNELKSQLTDLVRVNEALEMDLERTAESEAEGNNERYLLIQKIQEMEEKLASLEDLKSEVVQLSRERDTLVDKVQDLSQALVKSDQRLKETSGVIDRFRAERNDASQEAVCLNSQFSRAMKVIAELRGERTSDKKREEDLKICIETLKEEVDTAVGQRDSFKYELEVSRSALHEVRESIIAASRESHKALYEE